MANLVTEISVTWVWRRQTLERGLQKKTSFIEKNSPFFWTVMKIKVIWIELFGRNGETFTDNSKTNGTTN